ncbi:hypothetical protein BV898_03195 [Hypsibius exemplaris]|uniref:Ricin B lectin domain-containing protein n=1 Tax=Hypsibius exemplaris TaxID=2072580 RepID=A0A1W0X5T5_HYPEX|nr:hypothetical protein BV898_03195 [Hypsibius exemplaris]
MVSFNINAPFIIKDVDSKRVMQVFDGQGNRTDHPMCEQVIINDYDGSPSQVFTYRDGLIVSHKNGLVLDVSENPGDRKAIITWPAHGRFNQLWSISEYGEIKSQLRLVLAVRHSPSPIYPKLSVYATDKDTARNRDEYRKFVLVNV